MRSRRNGGFQLNLRARQWQLSTGLLLIDQDGRGDKQILGGTWIGDASILALLSDLGLAFSCLVIDWTHLCQIGRRIWRHLMLWLLLLLVMMVILLLEIAITIVVYTLKSL